ncbi:NAD(P)-binding protein [Wolfiporia cocos MD-104 SS10]|uniref:NAD(P)-binding protein n=1 Tax=Wolfiporia cocos (strain MD-104) TaxID=742152 RepID=A0A2H3JT21_WOLCO|nr:NAD(P)-binding protein [Wolfiporia cocos MD-104 SS10]
MADKFADGLPLRCADDYTTSVDRAGRDVVLLTGSTGSLGCHLLEAMVSSLSISRVYAFNRQARNGTDLRTRQAAALEERGINPTILDTPKVVLLEGDLTKKNWGLAAEIYHDLQHSVTHIIHNGIAWPVDWVSKLSAFEPAVKSLRSLIDFALTSPLPIVPRLLFASSISVLQRAPRDFSVPEGPVDPDFSMTNGYSEAKWVCEQVLYAAAAQTPLDPVIMRVGQLSGGPAGAWARNEYIPALVQSALHLGGLPDDPRIVNMLPLDVGAAAVLDCLYAPRTIITTHIVHPRGISWHSIAAVLSSELGVPLIPFDEWYRRLQTLAASSASKTKSTSGGYRRPRLHALLIIPVYQHMLATLHTGRMALGFPDEEVSQTLVASPTLADPALRDVGVADVRRWLAYWYKVGMLERPKALQSHL